MLMITTCCFKVKDTKFNGAKKFFILYLVILEIVTVVASVVLETAAVSVVSALAVLATAVVSVGSALVVISEVVTVVASAVVASCVTAAFVVIPALGIERLMQ